MTAEQSRAEQGRIRKADREDPRAIHQRIAADLGDEILSGESFRRAADCPPPPN
ncbi:hypothetical protein P3T35_008002 [Kitasatospora sp. GP30]|uniref:hypothetical protein n=1 Tax=Kitasatospora sp. GP30 TaxID=3035084 RepID=UPI00247BD382|nr:hypothetical protein [Kitasatospora sp. GP30]